MSIESARAFLERILSDTDFASQMADAASPEERRKLALSFGFDFSSEELGAVTKDLTDEELDQISAGGEAPSCVPVAFFVSG